MKKKAYSYLRFSTARQIEGDSQRRQLERSRKWCEENEVELVEEMQDHGVSAFRGKNRMLGVLGRFLALVTAGDIPEGTILIVENIDRLSREKVLEALKLYTDLITAGITIVTLLDNQTHSRESIEANPMVLQMAIASMCRANGESELKSDRICDKWAESRRLMLEGKPAPMGRLPCWLKREPKTREIIQHPRKVAAVQLIFEMASKGFSPHAITRQLNQDGHPTLTKRGKIRMWNKSAVYKILKSKSVMGTLIINEPYLDGRVKKYRKIAEREDYYPIIVSKATYAKVKLLLDAASKRSAKRKGGSKPAANNAFSGLLKEHGSGGGVQYTYRNYTLKDGTVKKTEYLRAQRGWWLGEGKMSFCWLYEDFQNIFVATCRLALQATAKTSKSENELKAVLVALGEAEEERENCYKGLAKAKQGHSFIATQIDLKTQAIEELQEKAEDLRNQIKAATHKRKAIPAKITDRQELHRILKTNVKLITMDMTRRWFRCELFSGITYEAMIDRQTHSVLVETTDFKVPQNAFQNLKIRQKSWGKSRFKQDADVKPSKIA